MAQQGLDEPYIGPVLQHQSRRRMPEQMTRALLFNARRADIFSDVLGQPLVLNGTMRSLPPLPSRMVIALRP